MNESTTTDKAWLQRLRHLAAKGGYAIRKDRVRRPSIGHLGGYMLTVVHTDTVVAGSNFDLTLRSLEERLTSTDPWRSRHFTNRFSFGPQRRGRS